MAAPLPPLQLVYPDGRDHVVAFDALESLPGRLSEAGLRPGACLVVTDSHVADLHLDRLLRALEEGGWHPRIKVLPPGEPTKSLQTLRVVYDWALAERVERASPLLAFGGGVIGDLGGFAAATLLRGLPLVHIPTTLMAQVDSAIGGKCGVNHTEGKNLIGAFYVPRLVLADPSLLTTLSDREWCAGLAEVVKAALVADRSFFDWLEGRVDMIIARDSTAATDLIRRSAAIKAQIVTADPHESGRRAVLNFGHTFGHALEAATGYELVTHGEAVALGMRAAARLSGTLFPDLPWSRADALIRRIPLAVEQRSLPADLSAFMLSDKKRALGRQRFVVLEEIGSARVVEDVPAQLIASAWEYVIDHT